jgi:hypothetical protein
MALDNFSNLKASIKARSKRNDISNDQLEEYIAQTESEFYTIPNSPLRVRAMEARSTATVSITSRFLALPDLFLQMRRLKINEPYTGSPDHDIKYYAPEQMPICNIPWLPSFFTVTTQLEFDSVPDLAYTVEMQYIKKITALDDTNTTNSILTDYPNIYVFGGLWALFQDAMEPDVAEYFYGKFVSAVQGANNADQAGRYGPAPVIRKEGYTP